MFFLSIRPAASIHLHFDKDLFLIKWTRKEDKVAESTEALLKIKTTLRKQNHDVDYLHFIIMTNWLILAPLVINDKHFLMICKIQNIRGNYNYFSVLAKKMNSLSNPTKRQIISSTNQCLFLCLFFSQPPQSAAVGTQSLGSRLAWALPISSSPSAIMAPPTTRPPLGPQVPAIRAVRPRRDGDTTGE